MRALVIGGTGFIGPWVVRGLAEAGCSVAVLHRGEHKSQLPPAGGHDDPSTIKQNLMKLFRGWHNSIEQLIEATEQSAILRNDIYDREPLTAWSGNRVTLLGDAAHPMTPNLGQGACQAIEDAAVLAACLAIAREWQPAVRAYEKRRIPRTTAIVGMSRRLGEIGQWDNSILCGLRDLAFRAMPDSMSLRQVASVVNHHALTAEECAMLIGGTRT